MTNKKKFFLPLVVLAGSLLAACSSNEIIARPPWINNKIIDNVDTKDNTMKVIYDAIKTLGDTNSGVLNNLLYAITENRIGNYDTELAKFASLENPDDEFKKFVDAHPYYQTTNNLAVELNEEGKRVSREMTSDEKYSVSLQMVKDHYQELTDDIAHKLYDEIKGDTYAEDGLFYETKYIQSLRKNMQNVPSTSEIKAHGITLHDGILLTPRGIDLDTGEMMRWSKYVHQFLSLDSVDGFDIYKNYIHDKAIKEVYRNYLIQTYVRDQRYSSLGRTYARKVKMITIPAVTCDEAPRLTSALMTRFAKNYIINTPEVNYNFSYLEDARNGIVGVDLTKPAYKLLSDDSLFSRLKVGATPEAKKDYPIKWNLHNPDGTLSSEQTYVFDGTKLGDLVKKYQDVYDITSSDTGQTFTHTLRKDYKVDVYNELTNKGAYSIEHGLYLKENEIRNTSYVKNGWFLKNGGLTDLGSTIRERLFNISISDIVDDPNASYSVNDYAKYFTIANTKKAFLTADHASADEDLVAIKDGSNYHIIEIEDAVSTSKLSVENNPNSYRYLKAKKGDATASAKAMNEIVYNVVKEVSSGDTYKSNAEQYYLMMSNIIFYDQDVYNYFKSQYPDLFR